MGAASWWRSAGSSVCRHPSKWANACAGLAKYRTRQTHSFHLCRWIAENQGCRVPPIVLALGVSASGGSKMSDNGAVNGDGKVAGRTS